MLLPNLLADKNHHDSQSYFVYPLFWIIFSKKTSFHAAEKNNKKEEDHIMSMKFATDILL